MRYFITLIKIMNEKRELELMNKIIKLMRVEMDTSIITQVVGMPYNLRAELKKKEDMVVKQISQKIFELLKPDFK